MPETLAVAKNAKFRFVDDRDALMRQLLPFVDRVAELTAAGRLEDAVLRASEEFPSASEYFAFDRGDVAETFGLLDRHLYSSPTIGALQVLTPHKTYDIDIASPEQLPLLGSILAACSDGRNSQSSLRALMTEDAAEVVSDLINIGALVSRERRQVFAGRKGSGVHRLQHASLLYRGQRSGVLVDPHLHSSYCPPGIQTDIYRDDLVDQVDAILISHFHGDHFNLSTLMMFPRDIPIVVPRVPRSTIICADMKTLLTECGFRNVIAVDWYSEPIVFGDIRVYVLPFFGEQPLRYQDSRDPDVRNWGNTYVVETDQYRSWFLIDSGADTRGSMQEVAHYVSRRFDRIDIVLSNLRRFMIHTPFYINGGLNWLTLSPAQMQNFNGLHDDCITLGPDGVAECCAIVGAKQYLPYAHWWGEVGRAADSAVDTPGQEELALVNELGEWLKRMKATTRIVPWRVGDSFLSIPGKGLVHVPIKAQAP